jgi:hypothetical protein
MPSDHDPERRIANARLIAAAPELLVTLEGILQWWEVTPCRPAGDEPSAIAEARAALANAKGGAA